MKPRLYIQLGRIGDILNVLPLCLRDFDELHTKPILMIAEPYVDLLDGVTYVEPLVWEGEFEDVAGAHAAAEKVAEERGRAIVCTQIYGKTLFAIEQCSSFLRESWSRVPNAPIWGTIPLVFDRRDLTREDGVRNQLLKRSTGKPYIVLALQGTSSPFAFHATLAAYLRNKLGKEFDFVDVTAFKAPRFYDLLSLLEGAFALVAVDSAVLHLAAAVPSLPVVAFITREPSCWHGSAWRLQQVARFFYDEMPEVSATVVDELRRARNARPPEIIHAFTSPANPDQDTTRRLSVAQSSWSREAMFYPGWRRADFAEVEASRRNSTDVGDPRPVPFVKDVIEHAISKATTDDAIIFYSNADVTFVPGLSGWILDRMRREGCAYTHRRDFVRLARAINSEAEAHRGEFYPGSDAFAFKVSWWRRHRDEFPDMLIGREQWDEVFRQLVKRHGGRDLPDAICHERHASFWEANGDNAGNAYNRRLARRWFMRTGYGPNDWQWWRPPGSSGPREVNP